jgi:dimethylargininase
MGDDGVRFSRAIVCPPASSFAAGITTAGLGAPDLCRALEQHAAYCDALSALGLALTRLPPDAGFPDSTFVEDTAILTQRGAILTRPGAASRAGEVAAVRAVLATLVPELARIEPPGTVDGGDVCQAGEHVFIGISQRTNAAGAEQLSRWLRARGYGTSTVDIRDVAGLLHLKSGLAWLGGRRLVVAPPLAGQATFRGYDELVLRPADTYAANCVRIGDGVILPAGYPELMRRIADLGLEPLALDMSEFRKMDGGPSCLSLRI